MTTQKELQKAIVKVIKSDKMTKKNIKPKTEKPKTEKTIKANDRNAKINTPCPVCKKVFKTYNSMTSHKTREHSKNTETYKHAHE